MNKAIWIPTVFFTLIGPLFSVFGAEFQPGNILVSSQNTLYEYTLDGILVSQMPIPQSASNEVARDIILLDDGSLAVYNGTFNPELSIYDGSTWENMNFEGWSTVNNGSYGGIANIGNNIFVTDCRTAGAEARGLLSIDLSENSANRFIDNSDYIDVTVGRNGLIYGLRNFYGDVDIFNPATLTLLRSVDLGHSSSSRSVTANENGEIFMVSWRGYIAHFDSNGVLLNTLSIGGNLHDINIDSEGYIIVGSRFGQIYLCDESLSDYFRIDVSDVNAFVAFVPLEQPPAPPVLSGYHLYWWRWIFTYLEWTTEAEVVDVYLNDRLIETAEGYNSATFWVNRRETQAFKVCITGSSDCSNEYIIFTENF